MSVEVPIDVTSDSEISPVRRDLDYENLANLPVDETETETETESDTESEEEPKYKEFLDGLDYIVYTKIMEFRKIRLPAIRVIEGAEEMNSIIDSLVESAKTAQRKEIRKLMDQHSDTSRKHRNTLAKHRRQWRKQATLLERATVEVNQLKSELEETKRAEKRTRQEAFSEVKQLKRELTEAKRSRLDNKDLLMCQICGVNKRDTILPCGHTICRDCNSRLTTRYDSTKCCPWCRNRFTDDEVRPFFLQM